MCRQTSNSVLKIFISLMIFRKHQLATTARNLKKKTKKFVWARAIEDILLK